MQIGIFFHYPFFFLNQNFNNTVTNVDIARKWVIKENRVLWFFLIAPNQLKRAISIYFQEEDVNDRE